MNKTRCHQYSNACGLHDIHLQKSGNDLDVLAPAGSGRLWSMSLSHGAAISRSTSCWEGKCLLLHTGAWTEYQGMCLKHAIFFILGENKQRAIRLCDTVVEWECVSSVDFHYRPQLTHQYFFSLKMEPKTKGLKQQQQQHKKLLAAMLSQDSFESVHSPTPSVIEEDIDNEDDAMELLGNFKN